MKELMSKYSESPDGLTQPGFSPATERGQKMREHILHVARRRLNEDPHTSVRIADIAKDASVPLGLIYHYFRNKEELKTQALKNAADELFSNLRNAPGGGDVFTSIYNGIIEFVRFYRNNPGLMRRFKDQQKETTKTAKMWMLENQRLYEKITDDMVQRMPDLKLTKEERLAAAFAMRGLCDSLLDEVYLFKNQSIINEFRTENELARFITILWHRTLYARNPDPRHLGKYAAFEGMVLPPPASDC